MPFQADIESKLVLVNGLTAANEELARKERMLSIQVQITYVSKDDGAAMQGATLVNSGPGAPPLIQPNQVSNNNKIASVAHRPEGVTDHFVAIFKVWTTILLMTECMCHYQSRRPLCPSSAGVPIFSQHPPCSSDTHLDRESEVPSISVRNAICLVR